MPECSRNDSGIERLNASGIVRTGCIFVKSSNPEWSFRKPIELFNESCVLWTFVFGRNFHRKFLNWNEPSLYFGLNWVWSGWVFVVEFVAVSSWSCCWRWLTGLTSRRWLPVSPNDDKWPSTRHHMRWLSELLVVWGGQKRLQCCCYLFMLCLCLSCEWLGVLFGRSLDLEFLSRVCSWTVRWNSGSSAQRKLQRRL